MELILYVLAKTVSVFLGAVMISMIARMLMPIFVDVEENAIYGLFCMISEPFIAPIRALLSLFGVGQNSPIDWAFFLSYFVLSFIRSVFPAI